MKLKGIVAAFGALAMIGIARADLIISQYYEGSSGTNRVIELWNTGDTDIDFSITNAVLQNFFNGGSTANTLTINSGIVAAGDVFLITNLDANGTIGFTAAGLTADLVATGNSGMNFNGDDALVLNLNGVIVDSFGQKGFDPGTGWTMGDVSSQNQNISLLPGITTGRLTPEDVFVITDSWQFVANADLSVGSFEGFGVAPVPEPTTVALVGMGIVVALFGFRRRRA